MTVVVIQPPELVVTAEEARDARIFTADDDDGYIEMLLEIAQSEIDGPKGWPQISVGEQVLQIVLPASCDVDAESLPLPPFVSIESNIVSDDGCTRTVVWNAGWPFNEVPKAIKHAIILMAGVLRDATPDAGGFVKRKTIEGVGSRDYSLPDGAAEQMKQVADRLLDRWRVYA
jgi:hypothetical protein